MVLCACVCVYVCVCVLSLYLLVMFEKDIYSHQLDKTHTCPVPSESTESQSQLRMAGHQSVRLPASQWLESTTQATRTDGNLSLVLTTQLEWWSQLHLQHFQAFSMDSAIPSSHGGILPLLRASLPLFRAVEVLASSGLSQSLALELLLDSVSGVSFGKPREKPKPFASWGSDSD